LTSTKFCAPEMTPLFRYASALGAVCVLFHVDATFVNARSCRRAAGDSVLERSEVNGRALRVVKLREYVEGVTERV